MRPFRRLHGLLMDLYPRPLLGSLVAAVVPDRLLVADVPHPAVVVEHYGCRAEIDAEIAPLIRELWRRDIGTLMSCQDAGGRVWIEFECGDHLLEFVELVLSTDRDPGLYNRITRAEEPADWRRFRRDRLWFFEAGQPVEIEPGRFALSASVRFPRSDLPAVIAAIEAAPE